jgi:hypothetical protein
MNGVTRYGVVIDWPGGEHPQPRKVFCAHCGTQLLPAVVRPAVISVRCACGTETRINLPATSRQWTPPAKPIATSKPKDRKNRKPSTVRVAEKIADGLPPCVFAPDEPRRPHREWPSLKEAMTSSAAVRVYRRTRGHLQRKRSAEAGAGVSRLSGPRHH